jgi:hypothetical protein
MADQPQTPCGSHELIDGLGMAVQTSLGVGNLADALRWGRQLADHSALAEVGHRATSWLLVADALAGNVDELLAGSTRFLDAWQRAGSPAKAALGPAAAAVAMIHNFRGDHDAEREWQMVLDRLGDSSERTYGYGALYDAMQLLHHGHAGQAMERMAPEPGEVWKWVTWIWLHWYVAIRAEATVLSGSPDARDRLADARGITAGNPVAGAIVERAEAFLDQDQERLLATADVFDSAGCRYQVARTMVLAGGEHAARGAALLADLGLAPQPVPERAD